MESILYLMDYIMTAAIAVPNLGLVWNFLIGTVMVSLHCSTPRPIKDGSFRIVWRQTDTKHRFPLGSVLIYRSLCPSRCRAV